MNKITRFTAFVCGLVLMIGSIAEAHGRWTIFQTADRQNYVLTQRMTRAGGVVYGAQYTRCYCHDRHHPLTINPYFAGRDTNAYSRAIVSGSDLIYAVSHRGHDFKNIVINSDRGRICLDAKLAKKLHDNLGHLAWITQ